MSGNSSGSFQSAGLTRSSGCSSSGNVSYWQSTSAGAALESGGKGFGFTINVSHTHNMQHIHSITADGGDESRPINYTQIVWKRIK